MRTAPNNARTHHTHRQHQAPPGVRPPPPPQVIVTQWSATDMLISWATCGGAMTPDASTAPARLNAALTPSVTLVPTAAPGGAAGNAVTANGVTTSYT